MIQIGEEDIAVGGLLNGHCGDHAAGAERTQNGQYFPAAVGCAFVDSASA